MWDTAVYMGGNYLRAAVKRSEISVGYVVLGHANGTGATLGSRQSSLMIRANGAQHSTNE